MTDDLSGFKNMKEQNERIKLISIFIFSIVVITSGCAVYPTKHIYFEPSAIDGETYDSTPCSHLSAEHDQIKREFNKTTISVSAYFSEGNNLQVSVIIEPRGNDINFKQNLFKIVDSTSGREFIPIHSKVDSREVRIAKSGFGSELVFRHWVTLTYGIISDSISDFDLVFSKGTLEMNSKPLDISPIHFKRKEDKTIGYGSINC